MSDPADQTTTTTTTSNAAVPTDQTTTTTTTNNAAAPTDTTTTTNDLTMDDLESNNDNDSIPSTSTLFPDIVPPVTRPVSLPSDVFQATLIASKTPISSSIVPGQLENKHLDKQS
ncbi:hypothetical protein PPL_02483 [Heterostelium album PN500]|uniref:Uncharacterized protein n=1 Tax=Heterostelium pallidum (strain ATCC 26659 / Pp 5 / PN500) TaxID=670386 RepID=D3B276_HETP5|nr:hypothetical protein PPL_02483 [Heterostelium album PN500]EFA84451.1 hypothetical protein PPL_02483 [Heterostelium album PN500]|eukprot:XP_020436565.1 hypothetical protein PPL_02483 [Heterostelium album PN500]